MSSPPRTSSVTTVRVQPAKSRPFSPLEAEAWNDYKAPETGATSSRTPLSSVEKDGMLAGIQGALRSHEERMEHLLDGLEQRLLQSLPARPARSDLPTLRTRSRHESNERRISTYSRKVAGQVEQNYIDTAAKGKEPSDAAKYADLLEHYSSIIRTVYALYMAICGGIDWHDAAGPLIGINSGLGALWAGYVAFAVLCVLNIITGVFVENANRHTAADDEMVLMEQMEQRQLWLQDVKELFKAAKRGDPSSDSMDIEEFLDTMTDVDVQVKLRKLGMEVETFTAEGLFHLLDFDGDGNLDLDEFATALSQVHGNARAIDLAKLQKDVQRMGKTIHYIENVCTRLADCFAEKDEG